MYKKVDVWLNNNPICEVTLEQSVRNEVWNLKNVPLIFVCGNGFGDGKAAIKIHADDILLKEDIINIENNAFDYKFQLQEPLKCCSKIDVKINDYVHSSLINLKKLYGNVKYYNGDIVKYPVIMSPINEMFALGDENGYFEIILSGKEQLAILDKNYSKENLEVWLENVNLQEDTEINILIGEAEVFGMEMWKQVGSDYIHFIPMSLNRVKEVKKHGAVNEIEIISNKESFARLNKEDISVYIDEEPVKILSFAEVEDYIGEINNEEIRRYGYVIHWFLQAELGWKKNSATDYCLRICNHKSGTRNGGDRAVC
jgi:hypothetical protein